MAFVDCGTDNVSLHNAVVHVSYCGRNCSRQSCRMSSWAIARAQFVVGLVNAVTSLRWSVHEVESIPMSVEPSAFEHSSCCVMWAEVVAIVQVLAGASSAISRVPPHCLEVSEPYPVFAGTIAVHVISVTE